MCDNPGMSYPVSVKIQRPERTANWRPIGHLVLGVIPWLVLHAVLNVVASVTAVIAWITVLVTGKLPPGIAAFHASYVRYRARTFAYTGFLTDEFPPFDFKPSLQDPGGSGITVDCSPKLENRNRLNVLFRFVVPFAWLTSLGMIGLMGGSSTFPAWLWVVQLALAAVLLPGAIFSTLVYIVALGASVLAAPAVIFTGRWPAMLFHLAAGWVKVDARLWGYSMLLTDDYPPFTID